MGLTRRPRRAPAAPPASRRGDIRDVLASADADGDGQLSPEEQAALIARLRGAVVVQEKSPEEAEAEEVRARARAQPAPPSLYRTRQCVVTGD